MAQPKYDDIEVGDQPIRLETDPISRTTLALYGGASGDHNPMHIDIDYAKAAGEFGRFRARHAGDGVSWSFRYLLGAAIGFAEL